MNEIHLLGIAREEIALLDRRIAPDATPVTVMLGLDFKRMWNLYKTLLTRHE